MDSTVDELVADVRSKLNETSADKRILIGLCGIPGSGKSQFAIHVAAKLNSLQKNAAHIAAAVVVGMDGWHLTRAQLAAMPDPEEAKARRGAAWTFDDEAFASFVERLRVSKLSEAVFAPSFSHAKKDPVQDDVQVRPGDRVVLIEGLYANVNEGAWARAAELYDARWVIECAESVAMERLVERHVQTGVAASKDEAIWRANNNDMPNGRYLLSHVLEPARRIRSADDAGWRGEG